MIRLLLMLAGLFVVSASAYALRGQGVVLLIDQRYQVSIIGSSKADGFAAPDGLFKLGSGAFLIADEGASAVLLWTPGSRPQVLAGPEHGILAPEEVLADAHGRIYFTDDSAGGLWRIEDGQVNLLAGPDQGLISTEGLAFAPDGSLLVGCGASGRLFRVTSDGGVSLLTDSVSKPESLCFDDAGNLYIADDEANVIWILHPDGTLRRLLDRHDGLEAPETIAWHAGKLFIVDDQAHKLLTWDREHGLQTIAIFTGKLRNVQSLLVDQAGVVYVTVQANTSRGRGYILRFTPLAAD